MTTSEQTTAFFEALARAVAEAERDRAERADPMTAALVEARDAESAAGRFELADSTQRLIDRTREHETPAPETPAPETAAPASQALGVAAGTDRQWLDDAALDALLEQAQDTRSGAMRFDPQAPGGFRVLTPAEDAELIAAITGSEQHDPAAQRYVEDREHLLGERDAARLAGDHVGVDVVEAHLEVLAAERRAAAQFTDPGLEDEEWER